MLATDWLRNERAKLVDYNLTTSSKYWSGHKSTCNKKARLYIKIILVTNTNWACLLITILKIKWPLLYYHNSSGNRFKYNVVASLISLVTSSGWPILCVRTVLPLPLMLMLTCNLTLLMVWDMEQEK